MIPKSAVLYTNIHKTSYQIGYVNTFIEKNTCNACTVSAHNKTLAFAQVKVVDLFCTRAGC